ncbi:globoside alpha-1,3-N-acetylgalactosaminyltransferase 1-like [Latimeria chalumnae]|uniref:globoside alpha-1,3-N-acetylgalactosaminyltransferase 1-like n=1 Tax=Latimeria chalumnae TaxID=7897 RepID=UPI0006D9324D|nr:PREDICTED: globoside alpha-1,3-N-acetylgalactosaminyltransferase 1-like [Latimeria chalumnae]|eukprot:XP_014339970.1 PREDICTED: globoside alpha-1,3-N-acetylgalactosaminyltransferase 1-like [Latimeria chalumnae]
MKGYSVNYYIFTDKPEEVPSIPLQPGHNLIIIQSPKYPTWQEISLRRMEIIGDNIKERFQKEVDYLFCLDIDMQFQNHFGIEALSELVAAIHPGYYNAPRNSFPYERRPISEAYVPADHGDFYYGGAIFGGLVSKVYEFTRTCKKGILKDDAKGIQAAWQEESHLNRYFIFNKPSKVLSIEYLWNDQAPKPPELKLARFATVPKNHKAVRDNGK